MPKRSRTAKPAAPSFKPTPAPADEAMITEELREAQKAYLLLQLFDADNQTLTRGEANKFRDLRKSAKISLSFAKAAVPNYRRERLAEMGYLKVTPGRTISYTLLPDGRDYLAACVRHLGHNDFKFTIKGKTLNALIAAASEPSFRTEPAPTKPISEQVIPDAAQLAEAVMAEFEDLCRERHGRSGLVPIHEVRQRITERFGAAAGRHDVLDEVILALWRDKRVGLEGISDLGSATEQQLNDSIPGVGNTIFYLEVPSGQSILA
jgi:hypothetical protein